MIFKRRRRKDGLEITLYEGDLPLEVVGESFYQENLARVERELGREVPAVLVPEPDNEYDENAVSVWVGGLKVGHLSRDTARIYQPGLMNLMRDRGKPIGLMGNVVGGHDDLYYGIWLRHDPTDFGVDVGTVVTRAQESGEVVDTGDAAHHAIWEDMVPRNRLLAVSHLRWLLTIETTPLERHFIYNDLEAHLYKARDAFRSALDEYDELVEAHHSEMSQIRPALIEEFGGIPRLPLYKQTCVRLDKASRPEEAITWADRGLNVYRDDALDEDNVTDLHKRKARYQKKTAAD